ncbi:MAG: enoyl-CoA hydratase/isomerase family protein [Rhizobiales bacterium]|nr:enoyl-CoA hydratase/isomerase family protein [Hyphomicrobiales bacterium]MBI3672284.1 enoyl-CoA hydratase/isomerase family protein [Hyphomicrobiales bacterium]
MREFETLLLEIDGRGVAKLTLNRPQKHNALDAAMIGDLTEAAGRLAADDAVRVVVLGAAGTSFCAGGDLGWMKQQVDASRGEREEAARHLAAMLRAMDELPKLVIGVIDGAAYGGGVGLAAVCDVVIANPAARFALSETRLGLIPATIAPYLHRRIGAAALRRLALHGMAFGAEEGKGIGLVSEVAEADRLAGVSERHVAQALACAPGAIADAKRLFRLIAAGAIGEAETIEALADRWESVEARDGISAFFGKADAPWQR